MHAVIALELRIVGQRLARDAVVIVHIEPLRLILQCEPEVGIRHEAGVGSLTRAVHVGFSIRADALRPIIETAGFSVINQLESLGDSVLCETLLVEIDPDVRNQRFPTELQK